jgi:hypothetical protein
MSKIQLRGLEVKLKTNGLRIITKAEPGKVEVGLNLEEAYLLFKFLYQHRQELLKVRSQAPVLQNTIDTMMPKLTDQLLEEIDWVRHLSN